MTTFVDIANDDRLWVRVIPAADLINLFWVPHQFVRDVAGRTLTDSFVVQFVERELEANGFVGSNGLLTSSDEYLVSGIDKTGVVTVEGVSADLPLNDARFPASTGHDSAFTKVQQTYYGGLHSDVRGDLRAAAATMVMAIRHRTSFESILSAMRWTQRILDGKGAEIKMRQQVKYDVQLGKAPIVYAHGTEETYPFSCHSEPGYINTDLDLGSDVAFESLPLTLTGVILKAN
jgi:hypothetical protein